MKVTILTENTVSRRGLLAEHGLSVLIEAGNRRILFDTGQSGVYLHNAQKLGISLEGLDGIVLSHGHYDHTGGLPEFPAAADCPVFLSEKALEDKWCLEKNGGPARCIGIPWREESGDGRIPGRLIFTAEKEEIFPDIYVLGGITSTVLEEAARDNLFRIRRDGQFIPDRMEDEQLLILRTARGLAVFAGCAHAGILSCLEKVRTSCPGEKCFFLLAGMHLRGCGEEQVNAVIDGLKQYGFSILIPLHCTGTLATARMRMAFGRSCLMAEAGKSFLIPEEETENRPRG